MLHHIPLFLSSTASPFFIRLIRFLTYSVIFTRSSSSICIVVLMPLLMYIRCPLSAPASAIYTFNCHLLSACQSRLKFVLISTMRPHHI
ncbi:hypothetical protein D1T48_gp08 [Thermoproteus tenax virus 1]|uniref:Uncharacterized 10.0 kDa protein n=1 Tax=Thermoproteus tenax virus 1 (strain KRA1) TaxID=10480 RepID=YOR8_TTV1K|nr:hypothetical protein D1T48_gp08 [Thermoproteus tenax virus 1]P19283.1 RecName: Full=Uncharacterized 10.0 kDa protein [Thermoproteus tenax virus 1 (STRAIN KRA1)]CAA32977.1 unnamed protein product [Thermoproteus tenax virus 1]